MFNPVCCVFDGHAQDEESGSATCRFCLGTDTAENMIAPCLCAGSCKFVHRTCLNEWRAQEVRPRAFTHCPSCRFQYLTECPSESPRDARLALWRFRLFVARDMGVLFGAVQLLIAAIASFVHMIDSAGRIPAMFPKDWASRHASVISVGPYYCTGAVVFFAGIGLMALILESCGATQYLGCSRPDGSVTNLGSEVRDGSRLGQRMQATECTCCADGANCTCCVDGTHCADCGGCASSEAAGLCCTLLLLLVAILAVLGVFVAIFFGTIILQKVIQSHIYLVEKREEARRLEVRDLRRVDTATMRLLAARPELVQVELEHISAEGSGDNAPLIPTQALIRP